MEIDEEYASRSRLTWKREGTAWVRETQIPTNGAHPTPRGVVERGINVRPVTTLVGGSVLL